MLHSIGVAFSIALLVLATYVASRPWRVHGGRFVAEYLTLAGAIALAGLLVLAIALIWT